ncbi:hypothetical protein BC936DRAFT_147834 [Jimgerdemannia flammicorona]|uniref:SNF2 family N-terminal domain-containing protein n=1 Tax=Jimgerdemannia flammicorona TaxID=994334 RepID=A0A433D4E9_9FUNG|nr:hypothetical protein BC936DRAFT_147834 [Jimgerdemannia flammicorona]
MIDWVRPQYLGELSSFRNQFKNPIEKVYADSTASEIKISHRQLYILKSAIGDLIQRKDATTLRRELQKKTEFVLAVRLTSLQQEFTLRYLATCQHNSDMTSGFLVKVNHLRSIANHPHIFQSYVFPEKKRKSTGSAISSIAGNGETANDPVEVDGELFEAAQVTPGEETALKALMQSLSANVQGKLEPHDP